MTYRLMLSPRVSEFLRKNPNEVNAFYRASRKVRRTVIRDSEFYFAPEISRYMLRFFRFGDCIAICKFVPAQNQIRVLECRRLVQIRHREEYTHET